ncbi:MAG: class I SAM-dependent DNA methyltransferase, partial [Hyphomicrobium sp.]|nr:class I SAM-dependent DNA methyltransferase [Hyphomicrobium sp.]
MDTNALKRFAQAARNLLIDQVTAKLAVVVDPASSARRENPGAMQKLDAAIAQLGQTQVIEQVAYTWFNRFTALRFMDVNGYTNPRVVSPEGDATRPELLAEAIAGNLPEGAPATIAALLDGRTPSRDPQGEAYRLLLVHACNAWHATMPFMFEKVGDYTELLMPEDLLSQTSILARLRDAMPEDDCKDVEIIGWLYQFYISEKKDQVFAGLKKNQKITAENIPAATQLFTPHWIVRYLVENSLGRLWLLNRPGSKLAEQMDYYIAPEEPETDFLKIGKPEELKVCDPACGSGHMLTYAFDLLYAIYEEEGYESDKIPALILQHNLTGIEIDDRAGALAAFALAMKAAARLGRRRFLRMETKPDIVVLKNVTFTPAEMQDVASVVGRDLFSDALRETLGQFNQAKNLGSLVVPKLRDPAETLRVVEARDFGGDLLLKEVQERVVAVLRMAEALSPKYHVVVANPPYMGGKGMNGPLNDFAKAKYPDSKSDLFAMFMERNLRMALKFGMMAMINMQSWMFLASFAELRRNIISKTRVLSLLHLGEYAFDMIDGTVVSTCCFVLESGRNKRENNPYVFRLTDPKGEMKKAELFRQQQKSKLTVNLDLLLEIEGSPIIYWKQSDIISLLGNSEKISEKFVSGGRLKTHGDDKFLRFHWEISREKLGGRWRKLSHGGGIRRWYGNTIRVADWDHRAKNHYAAHGGLPNVRFEGRVGATTTKIAFENAFRLKEADELYSSLAPTIFSKEIRGDKVLDALIILNSSLGKDILLTLNPTMTVNVGDMLSIPFASLSQDDRDLARFLLSAYKDDWNDHEIAIDFSRHILTEGTEAKLAARYEQVRSK